MNEMLDSYTQAAFATAAILQQENALLQRAPHILMRPAIFPDGNSWCALYGEDLQAGVAGFGDTPALAAADFDKNWGTQTLANHSGVPGTPCRPVPGDYERRIKELEPTLGKMRAMGRADMELREAGNARGADLPDGAQHD